MDGESKLRFWLEGISKVQYLKSNCGKCNLICFKFNNRAASL